MERTRRERKPPAKRILQALALTAALATGYAALCAVP